MTFRAVVAGCIAMVIAATPTSAAAADRVRSAQWHLSVLEVSTAHTTARGDGVTVALIDTGVQADHVDLDDAVLPGLDVLPDPAGDGRNDIAGHGTEMAGIIAGRGHAGGSGVLGIAPGSRLLPVRAPINAYASHDYMLRAVDFAKSRGAGVLNLSFSTADDAQLRDAVRAAVDADLVVVAGSGNLGDAVDGDFPGRYPEVLTVGAVGRDGLVADFSVTGPQVDLVAPGVDIVTTGIGRSGYYRGSGTSAAAAVVSGAAALVRAAHPELSAAEVVHRLVVTAADAGAPGRDDAYGRGRLDLVRALTADVEPPVPTTSPGPGGGGEAGRSAGAEAGGPAGGEAGRPAGGEAGGPAGGQEEGGRDGKARAAPGGDDGAEGPQRVSPLVVTGVAAGGVLVAGGVVVALMVLAGRRRRG